MEDWQQRVKDEHADLTVKLHKLKAFLCGKGVEALTPRTKRLMIKQRDAMEDYCWVLAERIKDFT